MKVDGHVIPVPLFVDIYIHTNTWASFFSDSRLHFFNDRRMCFFNDYLSRWRWRCCFRGRGYRRRRLRASGDCE